MSDSTAAGKPVVRSAATSDGIKIEYTVLGNGPPLVLLHGLFVGRASFSRQTSLAQKYRLICISSRGHDGSGRKFPANYAFDSTDIDDICRVLDAETITRTHLLGHSSGGAVAFAFARRCPDRVENLVLIEPTLLALLPPDVHSKIAESLAVIISAGERDGGSAALLPALEWGPNEAWLRLDEATRSARLEALSPMAAVVVPHLRALLNLAVTDTDVRAMRSTLLLYGTESYDFEPALNQRFRELRPDQPIVVVKGAGHNLHREYPDIVNSAIAEFLGR
jgi:pimeloyl-ACP methyl ester carboxylesterase